MTITFGDVNSRVRRQFGDSFGGRIGDDDILDWINASLREVVLANNLLQATANIPLIAGTFEYSLPANIMKIHSVAYKGVPLYGIESFKEFQQLNRDTEGKVTGEPVNFTIWAGKIRIFPYPSDGATGLNDPLQVFYTQLPTLLTGTGDAEVISLPDVYLNRIEEYCLAKAAELDEDREGYALKMQEFQTGVANTKDEEDWDLRGQYPFITPSTRDYGSSYDPYGWWA